MPFYEYECAKCGEKFEALISISDRDREEAKLACPACDAKGPKRLVSQFATCSSNAAGVPPCIFNCPSGG